MTNYADEFRPDLDLFREKTALFFKGELAPGDYKGISGGFGSYAQRGAQSCMLRLRTTGGRLSTEKLSWLSSAVDKQGIDLIHLTTCDSIQLHNLNEEQVSVLIEEAWDHGFITRGGGGDNPRNIMASPLTGVRRGESFDVMPYAEAAGDYLLGIMKSIRMPRKLKVCFCNSPANEVHATFRDLGFVATEKGNFNVYSAGGLGNNPRMGVLTDTEVSPSKILYYIRAMVDTFCQHGNYENRGRARTRYMVEDMGKDAYLSAFKENLEKLLNEGGLDIDSSPISYSREASGSETEPGTRAIPQRQPGLYAVLYKPAGGNIPPSVLRDLNEYLSDKKGIELRISPDQSLYIINLLPEEAKKVIELTPDSASCAFEMSSACIGASICQQGVRDSQALLTSCLKAVRDAGLPDNALPPIHISGCTSSCSAQQSAVIGFRGAVRKDSDGKPQSAFALTLDGSDVLMSECFGEDGGILFEKDIPAFLVEMGRAAADAGMDYSDWKRMHGQQFKEILDKFL